MSLYTNLTQIERDFLSKYLSEGKSKKEIWALLWRDPTTIRREIKRNSMCVWKARWKYAKTVYLPSKAHEKAKNDRYERYHLGNENQKRDLTNNDRSQWGAVHTKWERSNIDWKSPEAELMFGTGISQDVNRNFGPKGPTAFQRKLNQLADTKNKDTISEEKKFPINNLQKPVSTKVVNGEGLEKVEEIINEMPNLKEDTKLKIRW